MPEFFQPVAPGHIDMLTVPDGITPLTAAAQQLLADDDWLRVGDKLEKVLAVAARKTAGTQGLLVLVDQDREEFRDAKGRRDILANFVAKEGRAATEDELAKVEAAIDRAKRKFDGDSAALKAATEASFGGQTVANASVSLVNVIAKGGYQVSMVNAKPLAGSVTDVAAAGKSADDRDLAEIRAIKAAPGHKEQVLAAFIADLDRQAVKHTFSLSFGPGRPRFHLAQAVLPVETPGGEMATIDHLTPLVLAANRDALVAQITAQVDEHYANIHLALSDSEKAERIADIEAQMLTRHRGEAEAIWAALDRGEDVYFRKGLSPAAVLGIEGGPAVKLRGHDVLDD